ncbi:MAG: gamma-glutamyltransferase family protein [Nocardioidaceae bacterium]|nr:gamma-glutamyltransferase family protein [Nocardioidaceae bacterium]
MFTTRPELAGTFGMVASTHWLASQSGMAVLEDGGNAFDAAVAAGFVLQVIEPHLNGPGGEVPVLGWDAAKEAPFVVCGQGVAPQAATIGRFRELGLDLIPGAGLLAACVPGAFGGWLRLLRTHGALSLRRVLSHAIGYAGHGFPLSAGAASTVAMMESSFEAHWPSSAQVWMPEGGAPHAGTLFRNPVLAATYRGILETAEAASTDRDEQIEAAVQCFYRGFVAERIAEFCQAGAMDGTGQAHTGLLQYDDLAGWRATQEDPVQLDYHGYTVLKPGPWTQGPVFLQQLALLEGFDVAAMGASSAAFVHTVTECSKLAFADREAFYGDPKHVEVPLAELFSARYAAKRRRLVGDVADTGALRPGHPAGRRPRLPTMVGGEAGAEISEAVGEPTIRLRGTADGDTCHVDVVDRWGNMVAATPSGGWLQSSPVVPRLGFPLGTRAQMFWLEEGLPNSLAPGKRPRTTLTPTLAFRNDAQHRLGFGTPGGDAQDQWSLQFFCRHVHHGLNMQEAIEEPAFHTTHFPSSFYPRTANPGRLHVESRLGGETMAALRTRGHDVVVEDPWSLGRLSAVCRDRDGLLRAAANPRGMQGYAVGR